jgi:hypothetical protein
LRKRMAVMRSKARLETAACSEAEVKVAPCSEASNKAAACSRPRIEDGI